jgi:hypothetical protein
MSNDFIDPDGMMGGPDEQTGGNFAVLPAGTYPGVIVECEREKTKAGAVMARVRIEFEGPDGEKSSVYENIVFQKNCEWKLHAFMNATGMKQPKTPGRFNWHPQGLRVVAKLKVSQYEDKNGEKRDKNEIASYVDPQDGARELAKQSTKPKSDLPSTPAQSPRKAANPTTEPAMAGAAVAQDDDDDLTF